MGLISLQGKTALVTGAARRLGRAITQALAAEGASVVLHYRDSEAEAEALRQELAAAGTQAWTIQADLTDAAELEALVPRAMELAGGVDLLVNNASAFPPGTLEDLTLDSLTQNLAINAWAPFVLSRALHGSAARGSIVNLVDSHAVGYDWGHVGYLLSKQALASLTRMMALAFAPAFTVNAVAPGLILPPEGQDESYFAALIRNVPLRKHGDAEDIAAGVVFLLRSDFITGATLFVDGGWHLKQT